MPSAGIYGSRTIIPNNYYFTFDKIYSNETDIKNKGNNDSVLIGRCVLAEAERTVWLKTVNGYIKVAKLDNESRFEYSEGFILSEFDCIDDICSKGITPNGNGTYIVPFNTVGQFKYFGEDGLKAISNTVAYFKPSGSFNKDEVYYIKNQEGNFVQVENSNEENFEKYYIKISSIFETNGMLKESSPSSNYGELGTWPKVASMTQQNYLSGRTFLLHQYTGKPIGTNTEWKAYEYTETSKNTAILKIQQQLSRLYYKTKNGEYIKATSISSTDITDSVIEDLKVANENGTSSSTAQSEYFYYKQSGKIPVVQILTDITYDGQTVENNFKINQKNKTFIRTGLIKYTLETNSSNNNGRKKTGTTNFATDIYYEWNSTAGNFFETTNTSGSPQNIYFNRTIEWKDWEDVTEQYTGYVGNLNPYTEGNNLNESSLILATGPFNPETVYYVLGEEEPKEEIIDEATYYKNYNNETKTSKKYYIKTNSNRGNLDNVVDLTTGLVKLDEILGSSTRIGQSADGTVKTITRGNLSENLKNDSRSYKIPEDNIMDALVHHDADIGELEKIANLFNIKYTATNDETNIDEKGYAQVWSLVSAIRKLDNILGNNLRLTSTNVNTEPSTGKTNISDINDTRPYKITENNIIDTLVRIAADIGKLSDQDPAFNFNYVIKDGNFNNGELYSLSEAIKYINDKIIGNQSTLAGITNNQNGSVWNSSKTLIENLKAFNELIGEIKDISSNNNTKNANTLSQKITNINNYLGEVKNFTIANADGTTFASDTVNSNIDLITRLNRFSLNIGDIHSLKGNGINQNDNLVQKIQDLNDLIGDIYSLSGNDINQNDNLVKKIQDLNDLIGNVSSLTENTAGEQTNLIDKLKNINAIIGNVSNFINKTNSFIDKTKDEKLKDAISALNYLIKDKLGIETGRKSLQEQIDNYAELINNLAENVDYLDILVTQGGNNSGSETLIWNEL